MSKMGKYEKQARAFIDKLSLSTLTEMHAEMLLQEASYVEIHGRDAYQKATGLIEARMIKLAVS